LVQCRFTESHTVLYVMPFSARARAIIEQVVGLGDMMIYKDDTSVKTKRYSKKFNLMMIYKDDTSVKTKRCSKKFNENMIGCHN